MTDKYGEAKELLRAAMICMPTVSPPMSAALWMILSCWNRRQEPEWQA